MAEISDDFAFLSDDIIYDVLQVAHFERRTMPIDFTMPLGGRWGELVKCFTEYKFVKGEIEIEETRYSVESKDFRSVTYSIEQSKDFAINYILIGSKRKVTDLDKMMDLVPNFHEFLCLSIGGPHPPKLFLDNLRPRFTSIMWFPFSVTPIPGEIDFFKRQLRSPYLRSLAHNNSSVFAGGEFIDLLVDFVRKPGFQRLRGGLKTPTSGKIFQAAYDAWLERKDREHLNSEIYGFISTEDLLRFTSKIPDFRWVIQEGPTHFNKWHPTADNYKMSVTVCLFYRDGCPLSMRLEESTN